MSKPCSKSLALRLQIAICVFASVLEKFPRPEVALLRIKESMRPTALNQTAFRVPALLAVLALCVWPMLQPPCCCAASVSDNATVTSGCCASVDTAAASCCQSKTTADSKITKASSSTSNCHCEWTSQCDCEVRSTLTDSWVSSRVLTVDDQPVTFSMPIGLLEDLQYPLPSRRLDRQSDTSWQTALTSRDRCVLLCRWLN